VCACKCNSLFRLCPNDNDGRPKRLLTKQSNTSSLRRHLQAVHTIKYNELIDLEKSDSSPGPSKQQRLDSHMRVNFLVFVRAFIYSCDRSHVHLFVRLFAHSSIHAIARTFIYLCDRSHIHLFVRLFAHLFTYLLRTQHLLYIAVINCQSWNGKTRQNSTRLDKPD
jgi:hypothetical protein